MDLIDETMACAVNGEVDTGTLGNLYCRTMTVCQKAADFIRTADLAPMMKSRHDPYRLSNRSSRCSFNS
jgi:hypothetical protein